MCVAVLLIPTPLAPGMSRAAFDALHSVARIGRSYPDIELHISSGSTNDIIRGLEKRPDQSRLHPPGRKHRLAPFLLDRA